MSTGAVVDVFGPKVIGAQATAVRSLKIDFSEELDPESVSAKDFRVSELPVSKATVSEDGRSVTLTFTKDEKPGRAYVLNIPARAVSDPLGNVGAACEGLRFPGFGASGGVLSIGHGRGAERPRTMVGKRPSGLAVVDQLRLSATGGDVKVYGIAVRGLTTVSSLFNNITDVMLFADNGDGVFTPDARDPQLGVAQPFIQPAPGSPAIFADIGLSVLMGEQRDIWIVYRLGNLATRGAELGSKVGDGDIKLVTGRLAPYADVISANNGRTLVIDDQGPVMSSARLVDPVTLDVTFDDILDPGSVHPSEFRVEGREVSDAVLESDAHTVRLTLVDPITDGVSLDITRSGSRLRDLAGNPALAGGQVVALGPRAPLAARDLTPPSIPTNVVPTTGTVSPLIATVTWTGSSDGSGSGVAGYRVWRSELSTSGFESVGASVAPAYQDRLGTPGVKYWYKVSAYDHAGNESTLSAVSVKSVTATWTQTPHATYGTGNRCSLCHVSHSSATSEGILRAVGAAKGELPLCYECHDGSGGRDIRSEFTTTGAYTSGHNLEGLVDVGGKDLTNACSGCHGAHRDNDERPWLWAGSINGQTVTGNDNTWCLSCHDAANTWAGAGYAAKILAPSRDTSGYPYSGTFPGAAAYTSPSSNRHASILETAGATRAGDCRMCHEHHRGTSRYDMLVPGRTIRPSTFWTAPTDRSTGAYAQGCLTGCHDGTFWDPAKSKNIKQYVTNEPGDSTSYAGHRIKSTTPSLPVNAPLPCYDCHNAHGSSRGNRKLLSDALGQSLTTTGTAAQVRQFCFTCHTSGDNMVWEGSAFVNVSTLTGEKAKVEGLPRNGGAVGSGPGGVGKNWLYLKDFGGHRSGDTAQSCYDCHGDDYLPGKNNVHDPGPGESTGAMACLQSGCHDAMTTMKNSTTTFHHVITSDVASYTTVASPQTMTKSDSRRNCLICHVDHDIFNKSFNASNPGGRSRNLRASITSVPTKTVTTSYLDTDYDATQGGSCVGCHRVRMTKSDTSRTIDSVYTVPVGQTGFAASSHNYISVVSSFTQDMTAFRPNCAKCHNDRLQSRYQTGTVTYQTHESTTGALLTSAKQTFSATDPRESFCYLCHSRATDTGVNNPYGGSSYAAGAFDVYGTRALGALSLNVRSTFATASIVSSHPVGGGPGAVYVTCANCHNSHVTGPSNKTAQSPANTLSELVAYYSAWWSGADASVVTASRMNRDYCLSCHSAVAPPAALNDGTSYVPYSVVRIADISQPANPSRRTNNKNAYTARSHFSTSGEHQSANAKPIDKTCGDCHDRHSSKFPAMLGVLDRSTGYDPLGTRYIYRDTVNKTAITGNDNSVCYACHTTATTGYPGAESRTASGYPMTGRFPAPATVDTSFTPADHLGNPHKSANTIWPGRDVDGSNYKAGECRNCHDVHGTGNLFDELRSDNVAGSHDASFTYSPSYAGFCFNCHDGTPAANVKSEWPWQSGGSAGSAYAGHKIVSTSTVLPKGSALPCYECHNSHGSASAYGLQVGTLGTTASPFNFSNEQNARNFCLSCHVTFDGMGWGGGAVGNLVTVSVNTTIAGMDRTDQLNGLRLCDLSATSYEGHLSTDITKDCRACHASSGSSTHNLAIPAADSRECNSCHGLGTFSMANGITDTYHHALGTGTGSADAYKYGGLGSGYPTSASDVFCISCHTDHDYFGSRTAGTPAATRSKNLRIDIADPSGAATANTDFVATAANKGICTSCHRNSTANPLPKPAGMQKSDGTVGVPKIDGAVYEVSAHQYTVPTTFTAGNSVFNANCAKCHNSNSTTAYATRNLGVHASKERNILSSLGAIALGAPGEVTDPLSAIHCFRCHARQGELAGGKPQANKDYYGGATQGSMTAAAERIWTEFTIGSSHPVTPTATGRVYCESCHNPHIVTKTSRITDPDNNYATATVPYTAMADQTYYCLRCHDGTPPAYKLNATQYVVATVTADASWANKGSQLARSHYTTQTYGSFQAGGGVACQACHDKHGSNAEKLLGVYDVASGTNKVTGPHATTTITSNNNEVCRPCHTTAGIGYSAATPSLATMDAEEARRDANGYFSPTPGPTVTTMRWPGTAVFNLSPHYSALTYNGKPTRDCRTCHDVHGSSNPYDETPLGYRPVVAPASDSDYTMCFVCHDGDGPGDTNIALYYPVAVGGTGQASGDNAGHVIRTNDPAVKVPAGEPLPCYDCHSTHGSANGNMYLISDQRWKNIGDTKTSEAYQRQFCLGCHVTQDGWAWDPSSGGSGAYVQLTPSLSANMVEGIPRYPTAAYAYTNDLKIPTITATTVHTKDNTEGCSTGGGGDCHGATYGSSTGFNAHNPSPGISNGGVACYGCHSKYISMEDNAGAKVGNTRPPVAAEDPLNTEVFHHVMGGTYSAQTTDGDIGLGTSPNYPTSTQEMLCLSCHTDHNYFNGPNSAGNLRVDITDPSGAATANSDFVPADDKKGICTSCHLNSLSKDTTYQKRDVVVQPSTYSTMVPRVNGTTYTVSAHNYTVASYYKPGPSNSFNGNCVKCHDDNLDLIQQSTYKFGVHRSTERRILGALGVTTGVWGPSSENLAEQHCYRCHSKPSDFGTGSKPATGTDWYDTRSMSTTSELVYRAFTLPAAKSSRHPVSVQTSGTVECANCHNEHVVGSAENSRVTDPDNTYDLWPYKNSNRSFLTAGGQWDKTQYCLKCHDGTFPAYGVSATRYVPGSVDIIAAERTIMRKSIEATHSHMYSNGAIDNAEVVTCADCHDKHGSNAPKLLGIYDPATGASQLGTQTITDNTNSVCKGCHGPATTQPSGQPTMAPYGYPTAGGWNGFSIWETSFDSGAHTGSFHALPAVVWPGKAGKYAGGDCKNCHDVHGTKNTDKGYDMLRTENLAGVETSYTFSPKSFTFCFNCHDGSPSTDNIKQFYPTASGGTTTGATAGHAIRTAGGFLNVGDGLPCYDCHNPHGSSSPYGLQVNAGQGIIGDAPGEITLGPNPSATAERNFCFCCHTAGGQGWNGSSMAPVPATARVEGLLRNDLANDLGLGQSVTEHTPGNGTACSQCHGGATSAGGKNVHFTSMEGGAPASAHTATTTVSLYCGGCHKDDQGTNNANMTAIRVDDNNPGVARDGKHACSSCHTYVASSDPRTVDIGNESTHVRPQCENCHTVVAGEYHSADTSFTTSHTNGLPESCKYYCHSDDVLKMHYNYMDRNNSLEDWPAITWSGSYLTNLTSQVSTPGSAWSTLRTVNVNIAQNRLQIDTNMWVTPASSVRGFLRVKIGSTVVYGWNTTATVAEATTTVIDVTGYQGNRTVTLDMYRSYTKTGSWYVYNSLFRLREGTQGPQTVQHTTCDLCHRNNEIVWRSIGYAGRAAPYDEKAWNDASSTPIPGHSEPATGDPVINIRPGDSANWTVARHCTTEQGGCHQNPHNGAPAGLRDYHQGDHVGEHRDVVYSEGENVGCFGNCHAPNLLDEHFPNPTPAYFAADITGVGRTMNDIGNGTNCGICHTDKKSELGTVGPSAWKPAVRRAIGLKDLRCVSCHNGKIGAEWGADEGLHAPHETTQVLTTQFGYASNQPPPQGAINEFGAWPAGGGHDSFNTGLGIRETWLSGTYALPFNSTFLGTWSKTSNVLCTDCHVVLPANGPQGATVPYGLKTTGDGAIAGDWFNGLAPYSLNTAGGLGTAPPGLCGTCHGAWGGGFHSTGSHQGFDYGTGRSCVSCHIRIPHGWQRPRLLINSFNDPAPYTDPANIYRFQGIKGQVYTGNIPKTSCNTGGVCGNHTGPTESQLWP